MVELTQKTSAFLAMMGAALLTTVQLARATTSTPSSDTVDCPAETAACFDAAECWDCMSGVVDVDDCEEHYPLAADEGATDCQVWGALTCCSLDMSTQDCLGDAVTMDYLQCMLEEAGCALSDAPCAGGSGSGSDSSGSPPTGTPTPAPTPTEAPPTPPPTAPPTAPTTEPTLLTPPTGAPIVPLTDAPLSPPTPAPLVDAPLVRLTDVPISSPTPAPVIEAARTIAPVASPRREATMSPGIGEATVEPSVAPLALPPTLLPAGDSVESTDAPVSGSKAILGTVAPTTAAETPTVVPTPSPVAGGASSSSAIETTPAPVIVGDSDTRAPIASTSSDSTSNVRDLGVTPSPAAEPSQEGASATTNLNGAVGMAYVSSNTIGAWTAAMGFLIAVGLLAW